jgi:hypothetical protein
VVEEDCCGVLPGCVVIPSVFLGRIGDRRCGAHLDDEVEIFS